MQDEARRKIKKKYLKKEECIFVGETAINKDKVLSKSRVKYIQSLYHKKFRDEEGLFVVEGPKITTEFLVNAHGQIYELFALSKWIENNTNYLQNIAADKIIAIEEDDLKRISALSSPNQVLAVVKKKQQAFPAIMQTDKILMLDDIQDPGNLGTIIRIADWFGINKILCSTGCADMYNAKVIQSTMGSIMRVDVLYTDLVEWYKNNQHVVLYGAALHGKSVYEYAPIQHGVILMGNESKGISQALLLMCREKVTIPKIGVAESLNAAVATGIILSHLIRKQDG